MSDILGDIYGLYLLQVFCYTHFHAFGFDFSLTKISKEKMNVTNIKISFKILLYNDRNYNLYLILGNVIQFDEFLRNKFLALCCKLLYLIYSVYLNIIDINSF